jgi:hypothetical protein
LLAVEVVVRLGIVGRVESLLEIRVWTFALVVEGQHGMVHELELEIAFISSKNLVSQHIDGETWHLREALFEGLDGPFLV